MARKTHVQPQHKAPTVDLGIGGVRVPVHSHIAHLWETERDFAAAVGFLEAGLRGSDACVVIGSRADNERIRSLLGERGIDVAGFKAHKRLRFLERSPSARGMLKRISAACEAALAAGAPVVRLFGAVGWGREETADAELLLYEAQLAEIAQRFPCVILCLHEVRAVSGLILRHGVLATHPQTLEATGISSNPYFTPLPTFLKRHGTLAADVSERQRERATLRRQTEMLQQSYSELRALSARLRAAREEESARMAREIHDELGQLLTALRLDAAWLEKHLRASSRTTRGELSGKLQSMIGLLDAGMAAVQRIVTELRPGILDQLGIEAAVEWYVGEFQRRTGIACTLRSSLGDAALDGDHSTALFRILQEALTNVARHAEATAVEIRLAAAADRIVLTVTDNGRGIAPDQIADSRSLGLLGMRERARALGGDVVVRVRTGGGTAVEASLPR